MYIWLVSEDYVLFDTSFIILQIGKNIGKDFNERNITEKFLLQLILDAIKAEIQLDVFNTELVSKKTSQFLNQASFVAAISEDLKNNPKQEELFKRSPNAYFGIKALTHYSKKIEQYTLLPNRWLSNDPKYNPLISGDIMENAFLCGIINGIIDSLKGVPEGLAFFWEISTDIAKQEELVKSIKKLLEEENLIELIVKGTIAGYQKAERPEELAYEFGKDIIAVVEIVLGVITFFEGGAVSSFINGTKKVLRYLKRFGKGAIEDLKGLARKQLIEIFDNDINPRHFKSGTGGFLKYKRVLSRDVFRQEELNSCAAACIRQIAKDNGIDLPEKRIRELARTTDDGTFTDGIEDAMIKIFGKEIVEFKMVIDPDFNDIKAVKEISFDNNSWIAWIRPNARSKPHAVIVDKIIVDKIIGDQVYLKDPWPLKGIDSNSVKYLDNGDLDHKNVKWIENKGVEGIVNLNEFADQWAFGGNLVFKLK